MRKLFLLLPALAFVLMANATAPTITIDGDKSDWAEVPMLTEPGTWPMLKVLPAADANLGTNALVYMMEHTEDFDPTWAQYPNEFIDKDYDGSTNTIDSYWGFSAMGLEYHATTGVQVGESWISFPKAISSDNKVIEIGFPATYVTDLGEKFGFAMYYNDGAWFCPDRSTPAKESFSPANGFLYKTRSFTTVAGTTNLTTANVYAHPSMGEVGEYVDFGLRDNGYDTIRWAAFPIELTQPAVYDVTVNTSAPSTTNYKFELWLVDVASNAVVAHIARPESSKSSASYLCGTLDLREVPAGKYMLKVMNKKAFSKIRLNSIDLTYAGGNTTAIPGTLSIDDAVIANGKRQDGAIKFDNALTGTAEWKVSVASDTYMNIATTIKNQYGHNISIAVYEEDGVTLVDQVSEGGDKYTKNTEGLLIELGGMYLKAGNYVVKYSNATDGSDAKLVNIAFTYGGGNVQAMPGTTNIADAWFSSNGTRADGKISFPGSTIQDGWVKWNVSFASAANYNVTLNVNSNNCKNYTVALVDANDANVVTPLTLNDCDTKGAPVALSMGAMEVPAGNYILKVTNATQHSDAEIISVNFAYAGGSAIDLSKAAPAELLANADAIVSDDWSIEAGKITHAESKALTGWAKWNVDCADAGTYNVKVNIACDNGHLMRVEVFEDENQPAIYTLDEDEATKDDTGTQTINLGNIALDDKAYVFKVSNTRGYSHVQIASINIAYVGGETQNIPGTIALNEAILSTNAYRDANGLHFSDTEHKSTVSTEFAKWNIHADAGVYTFTFGVNGPDHGIYTIEVLDGNNSILSETYGHTGEGSHTTGSIYLDGDYVVQMQNTNNFSEGYLTSLSATAVSNVLIVDEMATDMQYIIDANGQSMKPALKRTFRTGVYNSICLPFNVSNAEELTKIFGAGYELLEMTAATLDGSVLSLNFATPADNIQYGRPYLIKPTKDVVNPIFNSHTINKSTSHLIVSGTDANFVGVLNMQNLGTHPENLYLGVDGNLYFSNSDVTIKGFRAYFHVNVPNAQQVIKRARIIAGENVITSVDFVKDANNGTLKTIENGQVIIIRDGVRYNVMGVKIQ